MCPAGAPFGLQRIISGGQAGVDRAALDVAIELGIPHGGWVPAGRLAEDGPILERYQVWELVGGGYDDRTESNIREADATLIVSEGPLTGGSALTKRLARKQGKPLLHVDLAICTCEQAAAEVRRWLAEHRPAVLNVAGPRESTTPGIHGHVQALLRQALS